MPLIKVYSHKPLEVSASTLHAALQRIWKVPAEVLKVLVLPLHDEASAFPEEDVYVDIRAKAKPERTPEVVNTAVKATWELFKEYRLASHIRVELYEPSLQSAFFSKL